MSHKQLPSPTPSAAQQSPPPVASTSRGPATTSSTSGSGSATATLPAVGTTFPTLEALRLACYAYARASPLAAGVKAAALAFASATLTPPLFAVACKPIISFGKWTEYPSAGGTVLSFGCTKNKNKKGVLRCPCRLDAVDDSTGYVVIRSAEEHNHNRTVDESVVRRRMHGRIARAAVVEEPRMGKEKTLPNGRPEKDATRKALASLQKYPTADELEREIRKRQAVRRPSTFSPNGN